MKLRAFWMLGLALLLAAGSVYLARNWLENQVRPVVVNEQLAPEIAVTKVVVAGSHLNFGNVLRREHIRLAEWPAAAVPAGAFTSIDEILSGEDERVVLRPVEANEPILKTKISGFGGRAILSSMVAPNMRAMTIRINDVTGVAGFILPGDHVDIMLSRDRSGAPITDILLQNIKVLGIDQDANQQRQQPGVVRAATFEVTPKQGQKLVLAQQVGTLSLALRHTTNVEAIQPQTVSLRDLRVGEANVPEQPEPTTLALTDKGEAQQDASPTKVVPKKPISLSKPANGKSIAKAATIGKAKRSPLSAVRIVRALKSTSYEVQPEDVSGSASKGATGSGSAVSTSKDSGQDGSAVE